MTAPFPAKPTFGGYVRANIPAPSGTTTITSTMSMGATPFVVVVDSNTVFSAVTPSATTVTSSTATASWVPKGPRPYIVNNIINEEVANEVVVAPGSTGYTPPGTVTTGWIPVIYDETVGQFHATVALGSATGSGQHSQNIRLLVDTGSGLT